MIVLPYGRKLPETNDKGNTFFPALEDNINLNDVHDHDGSNSKALNSHAIVPGRVDIDTTGYTASGIWQRKTVNMPAGYEWLTSVFSFYFDGGVKDKDQVFPKTEYIDDTSFYLYMPSSTQALTMVVK